MSFWLDDDVDDPYAPPGGGLLSQGGSSQRLTAATSLSQGSAAAAGAAAEEEEDDDAFRCEQCGGTDFIEDDGNNADYQVCAACYTQSQQSSQRQALSSQLEYEDVVGLAAKTRTGGIVSRRQPRRSTAGGGGGIGADGTRPSHWKKKLPLHDIDTSAPLPDLETCVAAFQTVLYRATERMVRLLLAGGRNKDTNNGDDDSDDDDENNKAKKFAKQVQATVRALWNAYLRSWADGAQHYGTLYPMSRFSLRDGFFPQLSHHKQQILNTVSHYTAQQQQQLTAAKDKQDKDNNIENPSHSQQDGGDDDQDENPAAVASAVPTSRKRRRSETDHTIDDEEEEEEVGKVTSADVATTTGTGTAGAGGRFLTRGSINRIVHAHVDAGDPVTYREAALNSPPSMNLVAALLWLAVYPSSDDAAGGVGGGAVTSSQLCHWIAAGSIPLTNAYGLLLSGEQQTALHSLESSFRMETPIMPAQLESLTAQLAVACRVKESARDLVVTTSNRVGTESTIVRTVTARSAPVVAARLCADLRLGQRTLDRCLALMGIITDAEAAAATAAAATASANTNKGTTVRLRLPEPLSKADPERLYTVQDVVAVVAIACLLDPHWRTWSYGLLEKNEPPPHQQQQPAAAEELEGRFIPLNDAQFHLLRNGPEMEGYVDYVRQEVLDERKSVMLDCLDKLLPIAASSKKSSAQRSWQSELDDDQQEEGEIDDDVSKSCIKPCSVVAGATIGPDDDSSSSKRKGEEKKKTRIIRSAQVEADPQKRMLIEFLAYSTRLEPEKLQAAIHIMLRKKDYY